LVKLYALCYGAVGSLVYLACYISALFGRFELPNSWRIVESLFLLHAIAMFATFQPGVKWEAAILATPMRVRTARMVLWVASINFLACSLLLLTNARLTRGEGSLHVGLVLTSFLLLNTLYIAIHWALRPERIFQDGFLTFISNPLGWFLARIKMKGLR
jgi:hypothetical protein